jgi:hypothetical protein
MLKYDLHEQGYSEMGKYQNHTAMAVIWIILTTVLIFSTFFTFAAIGELNSDNDFIYLLEDIGWMLQPFTFTIYLAVWIGIFVTIGFIISSQRRKNKSQTGILCGILAILSIIAFLFFIMLIVGMQLPEGESSFWDSLSSLGSSLGPWFSVSFLILYLVAYEFLYLAVKFTMTILFCRDKKYSIKMKIHYGMPICHCKEAFSVWETIAIYFIPIVFMYMYMFIRCVQSQIGPFILMYFFFMIFFMSYDLTAVVYALLFKIKDKVDYMSLDYHIYDVTIYRKSYVKFKRKAKIQHFGDSKYLESGKFNWSK